MMYPMPGERSRPSAGYRRSRPLAWTSSTWMGGSTESQLIPEENRTGLDRLRRHPKRLRRAVAIAGRLVGSAHVRGCRPEGDDRRGDLARWAAGPGLDAVIASAVRYAERTRRDHKTFSRSSEGFLR